MTADEYQEAARVLARETKMSTAAAARIEKALVSAMTPRHPDETLSRHLDRVPPGRERRPVATWVSWAAAAASVALIGGAAVIWQISASVGQQQAVVPPAAPVVSAIEPIRASDPPPVIDAPASKPPRSGASNPPSRSDVVRPSGFVALPWTAALPAFESGEIVRMDVPVASLPGYGIDISSGGDGTVEADMLIGQDGVARAIRLVTNTVRSTQ